MIDYAIARENMIESQVRPNGITDARVIDAMSEVPREVFVPEDIKSLAYMDEDVPLSVGSDGRKRHLMEPMAFARLLQAAVIQPDECVLDVGSAAGYSSAILSKLAQLVVAVEEDADLAEAANQNLLRLQINNVAVFNSSMHEGHQAEAPYDVIVINGRVGQVPDALLSQLTDGGRLVAVVGETDTAEVLVYTKAGDVTAPRYVCDASIPLLPGFEKADPGFIF
ncbi:MAG: protein-L-isoaspartate O-methyltransferase family protein [Anderseniella sp.]